MTVLLEANPWAKRRARATQLAERWDFAAEVLGFYASLLEVQAQAYAVALTERPAPDDVAAYAAERVVPRVVGLSAAGGPPALVNGVLACFDTADFPALIARWLAGEELPAVERFVARASTGPILEACPDLSPRACRGAAGMLPDDELHCPSCGGLPQLAIFEASPEDLVTAHRYLECSRCATSWAFPRLTCAACGETDTAKLVVYGEIGSTQAERSGGVIKSDAAARDAVSPEVRFPHLRVDGCTTCSRYLLTVDRERDGRAVPVVDEIGAIPLDLYAKERGMRKIVPNLMGF